MLNVFIICQSTSIKKIPYSYVLIDLQSNLLMRAQSAANDVEGVQYRRLHHVWILTSHDSQAAASILHDARLTTEFLSPSEL